MKIKVVVTLKNGVLDPQGKRFNKPSMVWDIQMFKV